jgi:hypothetical protein
MSSFGFKINKVLPSRSSLKTLAGNINILEYNYPIFITSSTGSSTGTSGNSTGSYTEGYKVAIGKATFIGVENEDVPVNSLIDGSPLTIPAGATIYMITQANKIIETGGSGYLDIYFEDYLDINFVSQQISLLPLNYGESFIFDDDLPVLLPASHAVRATITNDIDAGPVIFTFYYK